MGNVDAPVDLVGSIKVVNGQEEIDQEDSIIKEVSTIKVVSIIIKEVSMVKEVSMHKVDNQVLTVKEDLTREETDQEIISTNKIKVSVHLTDRLDTVLIAEYIPQHIFQHLVSIPPFVIFTGGIYLFIVTKILNYSQ